ncbi:MAG: hypothetical protein M0Z33_10550 [Actinomycetota bacterium]|nr:hypothetical protein [Actinomycetota bacterium]
MGRAPAVAGARRAPSPNKALRAAVGVIGGVDARTRQPGSTDRHVAAFTGIATGQPEWPWSRLELGTRLQSPAAPALPGSPAVAGRSSVDRARA